MAGQARGLQSCLSDDELAAKAFTGCFLRWLFNHRPNASNRIQQPFREVELPDVSLPAK